MTPFLLLGISCFQLATFVGKCVWQSELDKYLKLAQISTGRVLFQYIHACRYWSHIHIHTCMHTYYMYAHYMHACMHRAYIHQSLSSCISPSCTACSPASLPFFWLSLAFLPPSLASLARVRSLFRAKNCVGNTRVLSAAGYSQYKAVREATQKKMEKSVFEMCCFMMHLSILSTLAPLIHALVQ